MLVQPSLHTVEYYYINLGMAFGVVPIGNQTKALGVPGLILQYLCQTVVRPKYVI